MHALNFFYNMPAYKAFTESKKKKKKKCFKQSPITQWETLQYTYNAITVNFLYTFETCCCMRTAVQTLAAEQTPKSWGKGRERLLLYRAY